MTDSRCTIDETAARAAYSANHFGEYEAGSATAEYLRMADKARAIGEEQKKRVDARYHDRIDYYVGLYERRLADNLNAANRIAASVPSVLISGAGNFPTARKRKQNERMDRNIQEYGEIQAILDKIRTIGTGGISSDDENAVEKLQKKLMAREELQEQMKGVNAHYRTHGTLDGCGLLSGGQIAELKDSMERGLHLDGRPFASFQLSNNSAEIRRLRARIEKLQKAAHTDYPEWEFDGGRIVANREANRLQVLFDDKPDSDIRAELKASGFRWAPSQGAWQRQLTGNAYRAVRSIAALAPVQEGTGNDRD